MMLSKFFLDRPVFAWVIAIIMMTLGALMIYLMPVAQYPPIAPPSIAIEACYTGASAETVENTVTQIIEQKMTGLDNMLYLTGTSSSSGQSRIELTFAPGTDPDLAWTKVQNKLQLATASLPDSVQRFGIKVSKSTRNYLIVVGLISEDGSMNGEDLRDYAQSNLEKVLARVPGVGEVESFGTQYAMRVWVNPDRLTNYSLTMEDVITALRTYNVEISAGQLGGAPAEKGQRINAPIVVQHLLQTPEEFASIPIRINQDGSTIRVKDIGRTELGTERYDVSANFNGAPSAGMAIRQAAGANALDTTDAIKAKLAEMSLYFPPGMKVVYPFDTTPFTVVAIDEVITTLFEAVLLVFIIMYVFMGSIRATLIPTIAVPVVLLGTFAVLGIFGFSINMLTMFAMVLAIGLLVDDAIVVVENVERIMTEEGLPPREATAKSMDEITSALVGIGLVLSAVFGPMAFFQGSTGVLYRQFSITIIASMILSVIVALILTPVLCATFLKPVKKGHGPAVNAIFFMRPFFRWFERNFTRIRGFYIEIVHHSFSKKIRYLIFYGLLVLTVGFLFTRMSTSYIPDEDQGILLVQATLPSGSTLEQTEAVMDTVEKYFKEHEQDAVESVMPVSGISFGGQGQNMALGFVRLKPWEERDDPSLSVPSLANRAMRSFSQIKEATVYAFPPPPVVELGMASGFDFELLDMGGLGPQKLLAARDQLLGMAAQDPRLARVRPNGIEDSPQYYVDVNWEKAGALGVPISSIHTTLSAAFGGSYVNDFVQAGRVKKVYAQADSPYRMLPTDLEKLYVRNDLGKMVPFSSFAIGRWSTGSPKLERYNAFPATNIWGEAAPGYSTGEAMQAMEEIVRKLPDGIGYDWTGLSYQERMATSQGPILYAISIFVIFLCVAALYESWTIPFVNLLMLPLGVLGAIVATSLRGLHNDVYFQIGFLTTLGLSTKNAILIIQFIKERMGHGEELIEATLGAVKTRFRPVIMTSLAFFFGVLPLAINTGAGAGAMNAIGTAVCGGMLSATFIDLIFIPIFFVLIVNFFKKKTPSDQML
ncbi:efflux RND transporter permease subunit [Pseudodesulfovibrio thermohalotolerans]|uniref:efflux RND transporter permease subunit n=1 Tax=Pseudodesulfovibrio thermohalotolerans TaxID=2880651 RepID=UPI002442DDE4|nr:efflux RND transporter permease subunit [Pseudodesulfovibrio thermohalotolerans]WFS64213.1 efflux RND transporter permease subunit [Pseudodesulfovibrio thermohalotolerans]